MCLFCFIAGNLSNHAPQVRIVRVSNMRKSNHVFTDPVHFWTVPGERSSETWNSIWYSRAAARRAWRLWARSRRFDAGGHTPGRLLGTSAGAITATALAAGYTTDEIAATLLETVNERPVFTTFLGEPVALSDGRAGRGRNAAIPGREWICRWCPMCSSDGSMICCWNGWRPAPGCATCCPSSSGAAGIRRTPSSSGCASC